MRDFREHAVVHQAEMTTLHISDAARPIVAILRPEQDASQVQGGSPATNVRVAQISCSIKRNIEKGSPRKIKFILKSKKIITIVNLKLYCLKHYLF